MHKKAQAASSAAAFIALVTVAIVLYILFLPPDIRNDLLGDGSSSGDTSGGINNSGTVSVLLKQNVGHLNYVNTNEKSYDIPTVRVTSPTSGQVLKLVPSALVRNALFDKEKTSYSMDFAFDKESTKNVVLSFNVKDRTGPLSIKLNDKEIFNDQINVANPTPIKLNSQDLLDTNTLTFSVPNPGWSFWSTNQYSLENIQITGDITDFKNSAATQYFSLSQAEKDNLDTVKIFFNPVCTVSDVGPLEIDLNRNMIFDSVADCGTKSFATLDKNRILDGSNELKFSTMKGSYLLDNIYVKVTFTKPTYTTYFFDLSDDYFTLKDERARCGDYDGICPLGCSDYQDGDCCFKHNGYWCASTTSHSSDRCSYTVDAEDCSVCKTGYYDSSGDAPTNCQDRCGDNNDDTCPSNCLSPSKNYDADCCFASNSNNFWCKEVPTSGIADKCRSNIATSDCDLCPSGYINSDGDSPSSCTGDTFKYNDQTQVLLGNYDTKLTVRFVDDSKRKRVDININGHRISIDQQAIEYTKIIDDYILQGTNSVEIVPLEDIDISEIRVEIRRVN